MAPAAQPLFADDRPSSAHSEEQAAREDDALLGNPRKSTQRNRFAGWAQVGLFAWATVATIAVVVLAVVLHQHVSAPKDSKAKPSGKRNLIFMVSDGMGPASLSLTRSYRQFVDGLPIDDVLVLDQHFIGSSRTRSSNSLVTDSAAGATAFSCGNKSYNGAISMLPDHSPCGTVLEAAKKAGYLTGLVVLTAVTDATPACFASHVNMRIEEDSIAEQEVGNHPLGRVVDLVLGGGRCHFLPNTTQGSCRADGLDVTQLAQERYGWSYIDKKADFDALQLGSAVKLPLLGLFAPYNFPFKIDRPTSEVYPSLPDMARTAIKALEAATQDSDKGFFLMIEGSRIDHAGHANDPATQVREVLEYDQTFAVVQEFLDRSEVPGVVISTSDHETGGLATARQLQPLPAEPEYLWYPKVLADASHSAEYLAHELMSFITKPGKTPDLKKLEQFVRKDLVVEGLGIADATDDEIDLILNSPLLSGVYFADMVSRRAHIGWSTHGHSAVDVNIYGSKGSDFLHGNHENIEVGRFLREYLDVDVNAITLELNKKSDSFSISTSNHVGWTGKVPTEEEIKAAAWRQER
ncbi:alkaline phosphatase [Coleophoma crateriformis]|uniref:Alkaline phosphatase n=1 Tax=Coleophoma crateriformis TaxID=565419 RepID=A0A3D8T864_9HELO|nr:alkaline phosphatase [Coleophoma crateriformis]